MTVICGLLVMVPLIAGCGLFSDRQGLSSTPGTAPTEPMSVVPTNEPELTEQSAVLSVQESTALSTPSSQVRHAETASMNDPGHPAQAETIPAATPSSTKPEAVMEPPKQSVNSTLSLSSLPASGPITLEEYLLGSVAVIRGRLDSVTPTSRWFTIAGRTEHTPYVEFSFTLKETLSGSVMGTVGNSVSIEMSIINPASWTYPTAAEAKAYAREWAENERDLRWDSKDAILFLWLADSSERAFQGNRPDNVHYVFAQMGSMSHGNDEYSVSSTTNRVWLPATSEVGTAFYLTDPLKHPPGESITLIDLKARITSTTNSVDTSISGYKECLLEKLEIERISPMLPEFMSEHRELVESGLPANSPIFLIEDVDEGGGYYNWVVDGPDGELFSEVITDDDSNADNGYDIAIVQNRPLYQNEYEIHSVIQPPSLLPCSYVPNARLRNIIDVDGPVGTLHEFFFDPQTFGDAAISDDDDGVLKPRKFTDANGASATIQRIDWQAGTVKLKVSPHTAIAGHILDFIELDGSVSLSLDVADATADAANNTLSWSVSEQPWHDGDKLMVRIREAR